MSAAVSVPHAGALAVAPSVGASVLARLDARQRAAYARAQAAWLTRQTTLDERLPRYSRLVEADELRATAAVLRSLFDLASVDDVTVGATLDWIDTLLGAHEAGLHEVGHGASTISRGGATSSAALPLPLLWMPRRALDALEREIESDMEQQTAAFASGGRAAARGGAVELVAHELTLAAGAVGGDANHTKRRKPTNRDGGGDGQDRRSGAGPTRDRGGRRARGTTARGAGHATRANGAGQRADSGQHEANQGLAEVEEAPR